MHNAAMKTEKAIKLAGGATALAKLLGIKCQSVLGWGKTVPPLRVYQLRDLRPQWFVVGVTERTKRVRQQRG
jgi:DNA-binding transcriptional regulator Cro